MVRAEVELGDARRVVTEYNELVYSAGHLRAGTLWPRVDDSILLVDEHDLLDTDEARHDMQRVGGAGNQVSGMGNHPSP